MRAPGSSDISTSTLSVDYRSNKKLLFQDALLNSCTSEMERYCLENDIPFKILLIVDSSPGHAPFVGDLHPNIEVVFLSQPPLWSNQWIKKLPQLLKAAV